MGAMILLGVIVVLFLFCWVFYMRPFLFNVMKKELCCGQVPIKQKKKRKKLLDTQETK
jgi:hypothetical protein